MFVLRKSIGWHSESACRSGADLTSASTRLAPLLSSLHSQVKRRLGPRRVFTDPLFESFPPRAAGSSSFPARPCAGKPPFGASAFRPSWPHAPGPSFRDFSHCAKRLRYRIQCDNLRTPCARPSGNGVLRQKRSSASGAFAPSAPERFRF